MREIKFRAWDKDKEVMIFFDNEKDDYPESFWALNSGKPLMQYTGLKDSKGVEIYENDFIRCRSFNHYDKDGKLLRDDTSNYNQCGIVEWVSYNCSFMIMQRHLGREVVNQWNNSIELRPNEEIYWEMEVIGNKFQNPKLLNMES